MRRCLLLLTALLFALNCAAAAEISTWPGEDSGRMKVVNCEEWISLRAEPFTSSERVAQIPLGGTVYKCRPHSKVFTHCETGEGVSGYVLSEYLAGPSFQLRTAREGAEGTAILRSSAQFDGGWTVSFAPNGPQVLCARDYQGANGGERLRASAFDAQGNFLWGLCTESLNCTELDLTNAFAGGTPDRPLLLVYNADLGLAAIDPATGNPLWTVGTSTVNLGGSLSHAVAADGTLYVGGYYGPDPVAISPDGAVLWQGEAGEGAVWLYEIRVEGDEVVGEYEAPDDDGISRAVFDRATGAVLRSE